MFFKLLSLFIVTLITMSFLWNGLDMRKEIPSQEIIPLDGAIAIVSADKELAKKLKIILYSENGGTKKMFFDNKGFCIFGGLKNNRNYKIKIKRVDFKGKLLYKPLQMTILPRENGSRYFILVGASIGKGWEFEKLPFRQNWKSNIVLGFRAKYDFDKGDKIKDIVELPISISGVIIKECAAYFPRDIDKSQKLLKEWVVLLRNRNITPILATVVPVTKEHDAKRPGRFNSILLFNDFIRGYAYQENIEILDLEKALRISDEDRHLRDEYAQPDGLHLVKEAYLRLDQTILPLINHIILSNK